LWFSGSFLVGCTSAKAVAEIDHDVAKFSTVLTIDREMKGKIEAFKDRCRCARGMKLEARIMTAWPTIKSESLEERQGLARKINDSIVKAPFKPDPLKILHPLVWGFVKEHL
jgi:hypothetical protein